MARSPGGTPSKSRRRSSNTQRLSAARSIASVLKLHLHDKFKNARPSCSELDESTTEQDWADDDDAEPSVFVHGDVVPQPIRLPLTHSWFIRLLRMLLCLG